MVWFLFLVVIAGLVAVLIWDVRRKAAIREAASKERFEQMFNAKDAVPASAVEPSAFAPAAPAATETVAPAVPAHPARERFLGPPETLIYRLLKAGIPDHEIFANVTLASMIAVPGAGYDREQQLRRLSRYRFDFVICDKNMRIVAAIDVDTPQGVVTDEDRQFKSDSLKAAGIKMVRINPAALPRRDGIRAFIFGPSSAVG